MLRGTTTSEGLIGSRLAAAVSNLRKREEVLHLWERLPWRALHIGWRYPARQHDVAEYLQFLRPLLLSSTADSQWEARQESAEGQGIARVDKVESGSTWPLWLPTPLTAIARDQSLSLQNLVDAWHQQRGVQGLLTSPPALLLQVNRFGVGDNGSTKTSTYLTPEPYIMVPKFLQGLSQPNALEVEHVRYQLAAALLHEGPNATSGHYRAVLYDDDMQFLTQDSQPAQRIRAIAEWNHCHCNFYALVYMHCPGP